MKRKLISVLLSAALASALLAGCEAGGTAATGTVSETKTEDTAETESADTTETEVASTGAAGHTYAIVTKSAGNPYNEKEASGFQEVIEAEGGTCIVQHPESATADAQISVIQSLISQGVDSICLAANDENALAGVIADARDAGIQVLCLDSKVNPDSRATFVNQAGVNEIGQALMDAIYDLSEGTGDYAILSATSQAANQNAWIEAMKTIAETDSKYADLNLVEVAYGDDEPQKSTDQTQALLQNYPDLKVICAPTTVGIAAAAKVLQDQGSSVKLTGLGLPSEMAEYIGADEAHSCPYMFLWNPMDVGRLGAYTSIALVDGTITGAAGDTFEAGSMENSPYTIVDADDGGTEVILGPPYEFNPENIDEWKDVY